MPRLSSLVLAAGFLAAPCLAANPSGFVLPSEFADPRTVYYNGMYYGFATRNANSSLSEPVRNVPVATSTSLSSGWTYSNAKVLPNAGAWTDTDPQVWDPSVFAYSSNHFVMYYAAVPKGGSKHCIGVATATSILGTYTPQAKPLICDGNATLYISPNAFMYQGKPYIVHKAGNGPTSAVMLQQLSADGTQTVGSGIQLYHETGNEVDTEGPFMTFNPNANNHPIVLFVTGFYKNQNYKIQYAVAPTNALVPPKGKQYVLNSTPLLQTGLNNGVQLYAPGGPCFPRADAPHQMTFMADRGNQFSDGRSMRTANITFSADNKLGIL